MAIKKAAAKLNMAIAVVTINSIQLSCLFVLQP